VECRRFDAGIGIEAGGEKDGKDWLAVEGKRKTRQDYDGCSFKEWEGIKGEQWSRRRVEQRERRGWRLGDWRVHGFWRM
jgi:hypothetical protein